jgi:hypothetical protein
MAWFGRFNSRYSSLLGILRSVDGDLTSRTAYFPPLTPLHLHDMQGVKLSSNGLFIFHFPLSYFFTYFRTIKEASRVRIMCGIFGVYIQTAGTYTGVSGIILGFSRGRKYTYMCDILYG